MSDELNTQSSGGATTQTTIDEAAIVTAVRTNLDEIGLNDSDFSGSADETDLEKIIKQKIGYAYRFIYEKAPIDRLAGEYSTGNATRVGETNNSKLTIATNFRLLYIVGDDWNYPIKDAIYWDDPEYPTLLDSHTTGTSDRPKAGVTINTTNGNVGKFDVTLYGTKTGKILYVPYDEDYTTTSTIPTSLYPAFIYYVSALTLLSLKDSQHAEEMMAQAMSLLGIDTSNAK